MANNTIQTRVPATLKQDAEALAAAVRHTANAMMIAVTPRTRLRPNQCIGQTVPRVHKTNQL